MRGPTRARCPGSSNARASRVVTSGPVVAIRSHAGGHAREVTSVLDRYKDETGDYTQRMAPLVAALQRIVCRLSADGAETRELTGDVVLVGGRPMISEDKSRVASRFVAGARIRSALMPSAPLPEGSVSPPGESRAPDAGRARPDIAKLALAAFVAAAVVLAIAEAVARRLVPPQPPTYCSHPYAGHVFSPNLSIEYVARGGKGEPMRLETNAFGFRAKSMRTVEKPEGTRRIFFLGASVVAGVDFREEETISGLVEAALNERWKGSPRVECVNAAISGVTIQHTLSMLAHRVLPYAPDAIVIYEGANDELESLDPRYDPTHYAERVEAPDQLGRWIASRVRLRQAIARIRARRGRNPFLERPPLEVDRPIESWPAFDPEPGLKDWKGYLGMIEAIAAKVGLKVVVLTQGTLWREGPLPDAERKLIRLAFRFGPRTDVPSLARLHARYMDELRAFARKGGHALVDAEALLPKDAAHFIDDLHLTLAGNQVVAGAIARKLLEGGL